MGWNTYFHTPKAVPLIMTTIAVTVLFGLSFWQFQRLQWKEDLIAKIEKGQEEEPLQSLPESRQAYQDKRFYHVMLSGRFLEQPEIHIAARYFRSELGYHIFNPFRLTDGTLVLVNRGWVPSAKKSPESREAVDTNMKTIRAQIRTQNDRNPFTPANQAEKNVWFGRDIEAMAEYHDIQLMPHATFDLIGEQDPQSLPVPSKGDIDLRNDHLGYAITWFGIGVAVLAIFFVYHRKKPEAQ